MNLPNESISRANREDEYRRFLYDLPDEALEKRFSKFFNFPDRNEMMATIRECDPDGFEDKEFCSHYQDLEKYGLT